MKSNTPFLTAHWKELTMLNFALEPMVLRSVLPTGLQPDLLDGQAYASLVAFDFEKVRVGGVPWPGYTRFPEFNLRVYVRCEEAGRRGVFFIRELVPGRVPALIARLIYNEPYTACPMERRAIAHDDGSQTQFTTMALSGRVNQLQVRVGPGTTCPPPGSPGHWFKEQQWGFGVGRDGELRRYHVDHPTWLVRDVQEWDYDIDWKSMYGPFWQQQLAGARPDSVLHAVGSEVSVYPAVSVSRPHFS